MTTFNNNTRLIAAISNDDLVAATNGHSRHTASAELFSQHALSYLIIHGNVDMMNHAVYWLSMMPKKGTADAKIRKVLICLSKNKMFKKTDGKYEGTVAFRPLWNTCREVLASMEEREEVTPEQIVDAIYDRLLDDQWIAAPVEDNEVPLTEAQKLANKIVPKSFAGMDKYSSTIKSHLKAIYLEAHGEAWRGK